MRADDVPQPAVPAALAARPRWQASGLLLGGDYNPEQWPEDVWVDDVLRMREAGVGFATVGVFAWARLEPSPGEYRFDWLDRVIDLLNQHDVAYVLATATASPPPWLTHRHPEVRPVTADGVRLTHGSRQTWCASSPVYREHSLRLVEALAERYGEHPALALWHVSNELGCHNLHCYCDVTAAHFRRWLMERYGDLDALNDAWGTAFWSQRYGHVDEIAPPRRTGTSTNPTQALDFARFSSDALLDQHRAEAAVLRRITPRVPLTTNFMAHTYNPGLDYWAWAPEQDIVSQDHYLFAHTARGHVADALPAIAGDPAESAIAGDAARSAIAGSTAEVQSADAAGPVPGRARAAVDLRTAAELAFAGDLTRGVAGGDPWFLMEHSTSAVNWQPVNHAKGPGQTLRDSLAHVARGADTVGFFQWRASRAGSEKFHSALLPHAGTDSAQWREVVRLGDVLGRSSEIVGSRVADGEVALLFDWQSWWAVDRENTPSRLLRYVEQPLEAHSALWRAQLPVRFVGPHHEGRADSAETLRARLRGVRLLVVPTTYLMTEATAAVLREFTEAGGTLVVTYYSGIADDADHIGLGGYPAVLRDLLGVRVEEFHPLEADDLVVLDGPEGLVWAGDTWVELLTLQGAEAVAVIAEGELPGVPAVTRHRVGAGEAWYVATRLHPRSWDALVARLAATAGVTPTADVPAGVEAVRRTSETGIWLFLFNHTRSAQPVSATGHDLVTDGPVSGTWLLAAGASAVVREAAGHETAGPETAAGPATAAAGRDES